MSELLPCPFCGSAGVLDSLLAAERGRKWFVSCGDRACRVRPLTEANEASREEAIAAWNARSPQPSKAEERSAVLEEAARVVEDTDVVEVRGGMNSYYAQLGDAKATLREAACAIRALKQTQPGVPEGGTRVKNFDGEDEVHWPNGRPPAPPAPHPEVVDRSLVDAMAKLLRVQMSNCAHCAAIKGHCDGCYEGHALLEQYDALSSSPPSLLRTAEQEREAVVRWLRSQADDFAFRAGDMSMPHHRRRAFINGASEYLDVATYIERGDHLQTPGSEGEGASKGERPASGKASEPFTRSTEPSRTFARVEESIAPQTPGSDPRPPSSTQGGRR